MKKMFVFATCLFLLYGVVVAATPPQAPTSARTQTQIEVTHLLEFVQDADCQFDRNGTWHNGKDARAHLEMKYAYLTKRRLIDKTEDFIEKAASKSSFSGRAYQIKCRDGKTISSAKWLANELQRYRKKTRESKRHTATRALLGEAAYSRE